MVVDQPMDRHLHDWPHDRPHDRSSSDRTRQAIGLDGQAGDASSGWPAGASESAEALGRYLYQLLHPHDRGADASTLTADRIRSHQSLGALRNGPGQPCPAIDRQRLHALAQLYCRQSRLRSDTFDWILMDAVVFDELDQRDRDLQHYRLAAALHHALKFLLVYIGLPLLGYLWFVADGEPVPASWLVGWGVVVALHGLGAPFRWQDLQRARRLRQQYRKLYALLGQPGLSPAELRSALRQAATDGLVLDPSVYALVAGLDTGADQASAPARLRPAAPATTGAGTSPG